MQPGTLRGLKILVAVMGVLIVVGTATLAVLIVQRIGAGGGGAPASAGTARQLDEPTGTAIAAVAVGPDRVAIQLRGGGPDRVVLLDARTGAVVARIALTR